MNKQITTSSASFKKYCQKAYKRVSSSKLSVISTICICLSIIMLFSSMYLISHSINNGTKALMESYLSSLNYEKDNAYQALYQKYHDKALAKYRVSNHVSISLGNIRETALLEVLKVSDVEYIIEDAANNKNNITSWLEVPGEGTYVVDLEAAEFIIDDERSYILVRVPYPELTNLTIDYANVNKLLFKNDIFNDSYRVGEDLARKQLTAGELKIKKEFASNQYFYINAQKAATNVLTCLIKQLNPTIEDLTIEVEFY